MDVFGSGLAYVALNLVISSVWQISRGGVIITTALISWLFLKKKFTRPMVVGCVLALLGITSVQLVTILFANNDESRNVLSLVIGIGMILVSLMFIGVQFCYEKWLFDNYELSPIKLVAV